jgi:hypothetical protein
VMAALLNGWNNPRDEVSIVIESLIPSDIAIGYWRPS